MTGHDYQKILVNLSIEKADDAYDVGKMALKAGRLISAVNRLYYAAFYCVTALLQADGQSYVKHSALRAALHRDLVRTGRVPIEFGELFDRLFKDRQDGDYRPETKFDVEALTLLATQTNKFIEFVKNTFSQR
jgi:uncharacterized protein (UPF0332 family)